MIQKTIEFDGYDGAKHSKTYYFHMTKADLVEMKLYLEETGLDDYFRKISASDKASEVLPHFKDIVRKCIGVMSEDGVRFDKLDGDVWLEFIQTEAYSEFFMWLLENPTDAANFFTGILPAGMQDEVRKAQAKDQLELPTPGEKEETPALKIEDYSHQELIGMSTDQFEELMKGRDHKALSREILEIAMTRRYQNR